MRIAINAVNVKSYGISNYTLYLINSMQHIEGLQITLYVSKDRQGFYKKIQDTVYAIKVVPVKSTIAKNLWMHLCSPFSFWQYDILHSTGNMGPVFSPIPQIITIHDSYEIKSPERFSLLRRLLMRSIISIAGFNASHIIAVSSNTAKDISQAYDFLKHKVTAIYSGCNFSILSPEDVVYEKKKYFIFVGSLEPGKNLKTLIQAFNLIRNKGYTLKVIGTSELGWGEQPLSESDGVEMLGKVSDEELVTLYQESSALIFPSLYEGFGFPVIEAIANGCPVIAANNSAIPEAGGDVAHYFSALDMNQLAEKMIEVVSQDSTRQNNDILAGLKWVEKFQWDLTANETVKVYKKFMRCNITTSWLLGI